MRWGKIDRPGIFENPKIPGPFWELIWYTEGKTKGYPNGTRFAPDTIFRL
jgi:hypothetical protein